MGALPFWVIRGTRADFVQTGFLQQLFRELSVSKVLSSSMMRMRRPCQSCSNEIDKRCRGSACGAASVQTCDPPCIARANQSPTDELVEL